MKTKKKIMFEPIAWKFLCVWCKYGIEKIILYEQFYMKINNINL